MTTGMVIRNYRGWTIERNPGWWYATQLGELPLMADTLDGLKDLIRHPDEVERARKRVYG